MYSVLFYLIIVVVSASPFTFFFLMIRRPPRSTRTDTLFPYTTLFRSAIIYWTTIRSSLAQPITLCCSRRIRIIQISPWDGLAKPAPRQSELPDWQLGSKPNIQILEPKPCQARWSIGPSGRLPSSPPTNNPRPSEVQSKNISKRCSQVNDVG